MGNTITVEAIGGGQPDQMILPTGTTYSNANASITNGMFSPFVDGPLAFTLALSGVTANTTITGATFSFGTGLIPLFRLFRGVLRLLRQFRFQVHYRFLPLVC